MLVKRRYRFTEIRDTELPLTTLLLRVAAPTTWSTIFHGASIASFAKMAPLDEVHGIRSMATAEIALVPVIAKDGFVPATRFVRARRVGDQWTTHGRGWSPGLGWVILL
jgi:hypothetical protein